MTNRIRAGSDYPALTLSDLTDRLRRTPGVFITREQLAALAWFREVAGED